MTNQYSPERAEKQYRLKIASLIGIVTHAQTVADQARELAAQFMDDRELEDSDTCRVLENLSCSCEEALEVLYNEYRKGGRQ